jgi:hypothetical protein
MKYEYGHETERYVVGKWIKMRNYYNILVGNSEGKGPVEF